MLLTFIKKLPTKKPDKEGMEMLPETLSLYIGRKAPLTAKRYNSILKEWVGFIGWTRFGHATPKQCVKFLDAQARKKGQVSRYDNDDLASSATLKWKYDVLKSLYQRLLDAGEIRSNPWAHPSIELERVDARLKRTTEALPMEQVPKIINRPNQATKEGVRDRALLGCLFYAGLRRSEALNLKIGDICIGTTGLYFRLARTKAGKAQEQPISGALAELLGPLVSQRKAEGAQNKDDLFPTYVRETPRSRMSEKTLYRMFKRYCADAGLSENLSPHSARATAITKLLTEGVSTEQVQKFARHSNPATTAKYDKRERTLGHEVANLLKYELFFLATNFLGVYI